MTPGWARGLSPAGRSNHWRRFKEVRRQQEQRAALRAAQLRNMALHIRIGIMAVYQLANVAVGLLHAHRPFSRRLSNVIDLYRPQSKRDREEHALLWHPIRAGQAPPAAGSAVT